MVKDPKGDGRTSSKNMLEDMLKEHDGASLVRRNSSITSFASTTNESLSSGERIDPFAIEAPIVYIELNEKNKSGKKSFGLSSSAHPSQENIWGFYDLEDSDGNVFTDGTYTSTSVKEREAWSTYISKLFSATKQADKKYNHHDENDVNVLYAFNNNNPSQCFKLSSEDMQAAMELSCFISGFRISQLLWSGEIAAQFRFIYSYGSQSHTSWRSYSEFRELATILTYIHQNVNKKLFVRSLKIWAYIEHKKKMFRDLSIKYLIEKSMYLNKFMESVLFESPNPALLLYFAQTLRFEV